jgi:UDP-N-acetyl-D-mannosaminuronic acid transferase (WecB/TagA/CpsF family)
VREGDFLGFTFAKLPLKDAVARIAERARADAAFTYVTFVNFRNLACSRRAVAARRYFSSESWLTLNGSRAVSLLALFAGVAAPALSAVALTKAVLDKGVDPDDRIVIVGADAELTAAIAARYRLNNVQWRAAPKTATDGAVEAIAAFIAQARARYVFLCVEPPLQERIARAVASRGDAKGVALCLGDGLRRSMLRMLRKEGRLERALREAKRAFAPHAASDAITMFPARLYWLVVRLLRASISARRAL